MCDIRYIFFSANTFQYVLGCLSVIPNRFPSYLYIFVKFSHAFFAVAIVSAVYYLIFLYLHPFACITVVHLILY